MTYFGLKTTLNPIPEGSVRFDSEFMNSIYCPGGYETSSTGHFSLPDKSIVSTNGINNTKLGGYSMRDMCFRMGGGHQVFHVYNPTTNVLRDIQRYFLARTLYYATPVVGELHRTWDERFASMSSNGTILMICHSEGVTNVRNALMCYSPELRQEFRFSQYVLPVILMNRCVKKFCISVRKMICPFIR